MSLSVHGPHDFVSFLYLFFSFFFFLFFSFCFSYVFSRLGRKEERSVREEKLEFFFLKKIDITRLDYYALLFCACCPS